jgi:hypothetical protein
MDYRVQLVTPQPTYGGRFWRARMADRRGAAFCSPNDEQFQIGL